MLEFLKKTFKPRPKLKITTSTELPIVTKINEMLSHSNINDIVYSPTSKIYVINTYTNSFIDLTENIYTKNFQRSIIAINLHAYFNNSTIDIHDQLSKIVTHIPTLKLSSLIEHDLYEICSAFNDLLTLEKNNVR